VWACKIIKFFGDEVVGVPNMEHYFTFFLQHKIAFTSTCSP
jgi:hypothetical protein